MGNEQLKQNEAMENQKPGKSENTIKWKQNIVTDINAPQLYSRQVINGFSILVNVLFGGILLAINLKTINNRKAILPVLLYSIAYTGLMIYILILIPFNISALTIVFNVVGGRILCDYFWDKCIGNDFQYRTKPFWIPLIVAILITVFFILIWFMIA